MRVLPSPALAAGLLCYVASASAQTFSGVGPAPTLMLPPPVEPNGGDLVQPVPVPVVATVAARGPGLHRLPSTAAPLRLWGENGEIAWAFFVTDTEARTGGRFQIGYRASVSILPETSRLALSLNGTVVGTTPIDGTRGLRTVMLDVPPDALVHGFNAVRIQAEQRHRVDCSVAATYELWTQMDPETTGFLSVAEAPADLADLAAARAAPDGSMPIRLLQTGERLSERSVERLLGALQTVALAARLSEPTADFATTVEGRDGIVLAVATATELSGLMDLAGLGPVKGPRLALMPSPDAGRPLLVATGRDDAEVAQALFQLGSLATAPLRGSAAGLRTVENAVGHRVEGGETVTLAELGFSDAHIHARTHRIVFDLALPHDILPADYAKLALDLDASYSAGLAPGAQVVVDINGTTAASTPLGRSRGEDLNRRTLFLPLSLLRPGLNRISLTAELPHNDDRTCAAETGVPTERMHLAATSRLTIPLLARVGRQPELAETLSAGFPYAEAARRPTLAVPAPDRDTMAAAATLVARLGVAAGKPIPFAFATGRDGSVGPVLVVSPLRALDPSLLVAAGVEPQALRDAWAGRDAPAAATGPIAPARRQGVRDSIAACRAPAPPAGEPISQAASSPAGGPVFRKASAILAQGTTGPATDDLVTLVTAPTAAGLRQAVECLVHPLVWSRPQGRMALLSASDGTVAVQAAEAPRYVVTAPPTPMNLRRIAAGWLSLHTGLYGLFALALAGGLAGSTQLLVRNLGRRSK